MTPEDGLNQERALLEKIKGREAITGIIGMGYVGLPLAIEFAKAGFPVISLDIDEHKVNRINAGKSYIGHIPNQAIKFLSEHNCLATSDFSRLGETDCVLICVPTPLTRNHEPDVGFIRSTAETIARYLHPGQLVVLESTTYPGTTREVLKPILEHSGLTAGRDFFLAYSPKREDPGNTAFPTESLTKVVGGLTHRCLELACALYESVVAAVIPVSSPETAEATKLLENIFRSVNIALVNEMKMVFHRMGLDIWEVIAAAKSKPFGFMPFYPGPGLGGHCIPIDPFYLTWRAREFDISTRFIELAGEINTAMPSFVLARAVEALNDEMKSLKGSRILLLGVAYKKDVDDMRESPGLRLMELLQQRGAKIDYHDPHISILPATRKYRFEKQSVDLTSESVRAYDAVIIVTDHSAVDYDFIGREAGLIIDTRNAMAGRTGVSARVVKA
ncbi:MAG: nucleotide sugar dehydrogenase [Deltaproteobacteria bacterium]|nr:nucleotide sugar dehydrogenase [Deltaproteobacteria bacterium]